MPVDLGDSVRLTGGIERSSVNSVDGSTPAIATGYPSVEGQVRLSPDGSRRPRGADWCHSPVNVRGV